VDYILHQAAKPYGDVAVLTGPEIVEEVSYTRVLKLLYPFEDTGEESLIPHFQYLDRVLFLQQLAQLRGHFSYIFFYDQAENSRGDVENRTLTIVSWTPPVALPELYL